MMSDGKRGRRFNSVGAARVCKSKTEGHCSAVCDSRRWLVNSGMVFEAFNLVFVL